MIIWGRNRNCSLFVSNSSNFLMLLMKPWQSNSSRNIYDKIICHILPWHMQRPYLIIKTKGLFLFFICHNGKKCLIRIESHQLTESVNTWPFQRIHKTNQEGESVPLKVLPLKTQAKVPSTSHLESHLCTAVVLKLGCSLQLPGVP